MWFFIPLQFFYGEEPDFYNHLHSVFGSYETREAVDEALARLWPNDKNGQFLVFEGTIAMVQLSTLEKPEDEKRDPGNPDNYESDGKGGYLCKECGAKVLAAKVAHSVHFEEMPGAGSGECKYEDVPYCPNCDRKPDFHGTPVIQSLSDAMIR